MALQLDCTISSEHANSYIDIAFADDYWANHYSRIKRDLWNSLDSDDAKAQVLIQACRVIDSFRYTTDVRQKRLSPLQAQGLVSGYGARYADGPFRYDPWQYLQFPRHVDVGTDFQPYVPEGVMMAQAEQAVFLITFDESALANRLQGITLDKMNVGDISTTQEYASFGHMISPTAYEFVKDYMVRNTRIGRA